MPPTPDRRRRRTLAAPGVPEEARERRDLAPETDANTLEPATAHEVVESLLEQFGGQGGLTVAVERKRSNRGPGGYLGTYDVTDSLLDDVKRQHGGGEYRGRVYRGGRYQASISFAIAGPSKDDGAAASDDAPAAAGLAPLASVLANVLQSQRDLMDEMRRSREAQRATGVEEFVKIAQVLKELAPAPVAPVVHAPAGATDPVAALEQFLRMQKLLGELTPAGGADMTTLIRDSVTPLVGVLNKKLDIDRERMQRRALPVVDDITAPAAAADGVHPMPDPLAQLVGLIPGMARSYLASCASNDKDPDLYADLILDQLPGDVVEQLPELLGAPDASDRLCALVPHWRPYGRWFRELVAALLAKFQEDGGERGAGDADATMEAAG